MGMTGQGIEMRGDIAGDAGITVLPPGAAEIAALLQDQDVVETGASRLERQDDAGEPGADDQDIGAVSAH
jgi:hypothetical protein